MIRMIKYSHIKNIYPPLRTTTLDNIVEPYANIFFVYDYHLSEKIITNSLKKALKTFPYFSGRLVKDNDGELIIVDNNEGAWLSIEHLNGIIPNEASDHLVSSNMDFLMKDDYKTKFSDGVEHPLLRIRLTEYWNGSIIEFVFSHRLCDGTSFIHFLTHWSNLIRGKDVSLPIFDRSKVLLLESQEKPEKAEFFPFVKRDITKIIPLDTVFDIFHLTHSMLKKISHNAAKIPGVEGFYMDDDLWIAYVWKLIVSCQKDKNVAVMNVTNARELLGLNKRYFGNAVLVPFLKKTTEEIINMDICTIAILLRNLTYQLARNTSALKRDIAYIKYMLEQTGYLPKSSCYLNCSTLINNVSSLPYSSIDFGSGIPIRYGVYNSEIGFRYVLALPAPTNNVNDAAITLQMHLPQEEMNQFRNKLQLGLYLD